MELNGLRIAKRQTKLKKNSIYDFFKFGRGGFEDKVLINLIYSLGLILFVYANWSFIFGGKILYGTSFSFQSYPLTVEYFKAISEGLYPFFSWNYGVGFNSLADSQQSLLHPLKILLSIILQSPYRIDTIFLLFHVALIFITSIKLSNYFLLNTKYSYEKAIIATYLATVIILNISIFSNYAHVFFVAVFAYFLVLIFLIDKFLSNPSRWCFFQIVVTTWLMLLCGNFALQWVVLAALVIFMGCRVFQEKLSFSAAILVIVAFGLAFVIAAPQILATYEAMLLSARSTPGGYDKFFMSAGPVQWLSYVAPGSSYLLYKYGHEVFARWGDNSLTDGLHYIGVIPVALFFYSLAKLKDMPRQVKIFSSAALLMAIRAAGLFAFVNLLLNQLPIFGQFRAPIRSFWVLDVLILLPTIFVLANVRSIDMHRLRQILNAIILVIICVTVCAFIVSLGWERSLQENWNLLAVKEIAYCFVSLTIALLGRAFVSKKRRTNGRSLLIVLVGLSTLDLGLHHLGVAKEWTDPTVTMLDERSSVVDRRCDEMETQRVWMDFTWPQFSTTIFPLTSSQGKFHSNEESLPTPELNGITCTLTYSLVSSRLSSRGINVFYDRWIQEFDDEERYSLLKYMGFDSYSLINSNVGNSSASEEFVTIPSPSLPIPTAVKKLETVIESLEHNAEPTFIGQLDNVYMFLNQLELIQYLPRTERETVRLSNGNVALLLPSPFYYLIEYEGSSVVPIQSYGPWYILPDEVSGSVKVTYVPVPELIGIFLSIVGILMTGLIILLFRSDWNVRLDFLHRLTSTIVGAIQKGFVALVRTPNYRNLLFGVSALITAAIAIAGFTVLNTMAIAVSFSFLIILLYAVYGIVIAVGNDHLYGYGAAALVAFSFSIGMLYAALNAVINKPGIGSSILEILDIALKSFGFGN